MLAINESMENAEAFKLKVEEEEDAVEEDAEEVLEGDAGLGSEPPFINIAAAIAVAAE